MAGSNKGDGFVSGGGINNEPEVEAPVQVLSTAATTQAPISETRGDNKIQRQIKKEERMATQFGNDPDALYRSLGKDVTFNKGAKQQTKAQDAVKGTKTTEFRISKKNKSKFQKAKADFEARGGTKATAETVTRTGGGGGAFQATGDFSGSGINIGGVKPLGG